MVCHRQPLPASSTDGALSRYDRHQGEEQEPKVACPFHKKSFSLENGKCLSGDDYCIQTYAVKVEDGMVHVEGPA